MKEGGWRQGGNGDARVRCGTGDYDDEGSTTRTRRRLEATRHAASAAFGGQAGGDAAEYEAVDDGADVGPIFFTRIGRVRRGKTA